MQGIDATTGQRLEGLAHLRQSIRDILTTPIGTRVMRRDYGSRVFEFVDNPITPSTTLGIYAAAAEALRRWEPRFRLKRVQLHELRPNGLALSLTGTDPDGNPLVLEGIRIK